jgi:GT2 family glycosyltransferase
MHDPAPRLSVVIPTFNTRDLTVRCCAAVSREDAAAEMIVVDDGGSDGTAEAIERLYPDGRVLRNATNRGFSVSANCGIEEATGEIVLLLNSDTEVQPGSLRMLCAAFEDPRVGIAGAQLCDRDGKLQWSGGRLPTPLWLFALTSGIASALGRFTLYRRIVPAGASGSRVRWVSGAAMAIRRTVREEIGLLDETFRFYGQDLDFCVRAAARGWSVELVSSALVIHDHGATIAHSLGRAVHADPSLLWRDLLHWATRHGGIGAGRVAYRWMRYGAGLRIAARRVFSLARLDRSRDQEVTRRYEIARDALHEYARTMLV